MNDLTEFLLARIAEDESAAMYALSREDGGALDYGGQWFGAIKHAERWEPTRVLVECEAKCTLVTGYAPDAWLLGQLALPYAGHPDYREEWRP